MARKVGGKSDVEKGSAAAAHQDVSTDTSNLTGSAMGALAGVPIANGDSDSSGSSSSSSNGGGGGGSVTYINGGSGITQADLDAVEAARQAAIAQLEKERNENLQKQNMAKAAQEQANMAAARKANERPIQVASTLNNLSNTVTGQDTTSEDNHLGALYRRITNKEGKGGDEAANTHQGQAKDTSANNINQTEQTEVANSEIEDEPVSFSESAPSRNARYRPAAAAKAAQEIPVAASQMQQAQNEAAKEAVKEQQERIHEQEEGDKVPVGKVPPSPRGYGKPKGTYHTDNTGHENVPPADWENQQDAEFGPDAHGNPDYAEAARRWGNDAENNVSPEEAEYLKQLEILDKNLTMADMLNFNVKKRNKKKSDAKNITESRHKGYEHTRELYPDMTLDAESIYNEDKLSKGEMPTHVERANFKLQKAVNAIRETFITGGVRLKNSKIDKKTGEIFDSKTAQPLIRSLMKFYDCSRTSAMQLIMLRLGISQDTNGNIMNQRAEDFELTDENLEAAVTAIFESQRINGHPLGQLESTDIIIAGSRRYPIPVYTEMLARDLTMHDGQLSSMDWFELREKGREDYLNRIRPEIIANTALGRKIEQRYALDTMVRAITSIDGTSASFWNVSDALQAADDMLQDNLDAIAADKDNKEVYEAQNEYIRQAKHDMVHSYAKADKVRDANGDIMWRAKHGRVSQAFMAMANIERFAGVWANPPIILAGMMEHTMGNLTSTAAELALKGIVVDPEYRDTKLINQYASLDEAKDAMRAFKYLQNSPGGHAAQVLFANSDYAPTLDGARKFLTDYQISLTKKEPKKAAQFSDYLKMKTDFLLPGDAGFRGWDNKIFLSALCYSMDAAHKRGEASLTAEQMETALASEGAGKFIKDVMKYRAGRDAFITSTAGNMGRITPINYEIDKFMRLNGFTNFMLTTYLATYIRYGVSFMQTMAPMCYSIQYCAVKGYTNFRQAFNPDYNPPVLNNMMGGYEDTFWHGLRKNLIYDFVRLGNTAMIAAVSLCVIMTLGLEKPEDEPDGDNKFNWREYRIGGESFIPAWWANDLVTWGLPCAYAVASLIKWPDEPDRAWGIFREGTYEMCLGNSVMNLLEGMRDAQDDFEAFQAVLNGESANMNWQNYLGIQVELGVAKIAQKMTPGVLSLPQRDTMILGENARKHTPYKVYDREDAAAKAYREEDPDHKFQNREDAHLKEVTDPFERLRRKASQYNPIYALFNNATKNGYLFDTRDTDKTGYLWWEMPVNTHSDPAAMYYYDALEFKDSDVPANAEEAEIFKEAQAQKVIDAIGKFDSPEAAAANNFVLPYNARHNAQEYCFNQIAKLQLDFNQKARSGAFTRNEFWEEKDRLDANKNYYYNLINNWFKNDIIPYSDAGYVELLSDWGRQYINKTTGEAGTGWDTILNPGAYETRYYRLGNHPTSFLPFTTVDRHRDERGFNAETKAKWFDAERSDLPALFAETQGKVFSKGRFAGQEVAGVLFGGQGADKANPDSYAIPTDGSVAPTINERSFVPIDTKLPDSIKKYSLDDAMAKLGITKDDLDKDTKDAMSVALSSNNRSGGGTYYPYGRSGGSRNYRAWRSYGGSGGFTGTQYNPKIYSTPKSVNADRASTMHTQRPTSPTEDYLRPNFKTKGSREAYTRGDI